MSDVPVPARPFGFFSRLRHINGAILIGGVIVGALLAMSLVGPFFVGDPIRFDPLDRLTPPGADFLFGTDQYGRDILARTVYGGQTSLMVGFSVAILATVFGVAIGLLAGFYRVVDAVVMRVMDGLMAIPTILLAIALMTLTEGSVLNVVLAVTIAEIPRVVRLARSIVLSVRTMPFVEATIAAGSSDLRILIRHVLPSTLAPITVQATFICASAILIEATLSFLGAGPPPELPSWGNTIADGRSYFIIAPWIVLIPGAFLALLILGINILGDGMRDKLDPRARRNL